MRNVPKLRFSWFSDEWEETSISNVCKLSSGSTPSKAKKENWNGEYLWVTSGELKSKFIYDTIDKTTEQGKKESNLREYEKGTFVIAIYGLEAQGTRGSSAILGEKATISQACMALEPIKDLNSEFLYSWYQKYGEMIGIRYAQGTKQQNLSTDLVGNLRIVVPKKEEQEKVANFLTKVDKLVEKQDEKVSNLEQYKKGMIQKIFSQEIRFKKDDGGEYPEWERKQLKDIVVNKSKGGLPQYSEIDGNVLLNNEYLEGTNTVPVYVTNEINVAKNDVLILWDGSQSGKVYTGATGVLGSTFVSIKLNETNNNRYIYQLLNSKKDLIQTVWREGSGVPHVAKDFVENFKVKLPCLEEQTKIANFLSKIDSIVEKEKEKLEELRVWKKGLLQGMFV